MDRCVLQVACGFSRILSLLDSVINNIWDTNQPQINQITIHRDLLSLFIVIWKFCLYDKIRQKRKEKKRRKKNAWNCLGRWNKINFDGTSSAEASARSKNQIARKTTVFPWWRPPSASGKRDESGRNNKSRRPPVALESGSGVLSSEVCVSAHVVACAGR